VEFKRALKEETMANFKKDLDHIMKVQVRNGTAPGLRPPPLVKEIDLMLEKKPSPIEEKDLPVSAPQQENKSFEDKPLDGTKYVVVLTATESVDIGNPIVANWEMKVGESTSYDWIGLFPVDQPNRQYVTYQWRGKSDTTKGTVTFTAPSVYGSYELRYFVNSSYQHVAMSNRILVGPKIELNARFDETGKKVLVKWNQLCGNSYSRAWIGFYEKPQTNNKLYITWEYATSLEIAFAAPVKPMEYEFRFFTNSYEDVVRSNIIRIDGQDTLSASIEKGLITVKPHILSVDPYYEATWVGVFFITETDNRQWRRYKYITDRDAEVTFKAPRTPGEYEVRLFANKTYDPIVKSHSFKIEKQQ